MPLTKDQLRTQLRQARLEMTEEEHQLKSAAIVDRLKTAHDWSKVRTVHYFEPIRELLEPDTSGFVTYLEDTYPHLKLFTPRLIGGNWQLIAVRGGIAPEEFDVVLVPMLGFDPMSLHRIGYGGGYYDRLLATQPQVRKIGISFESSKLKHIPIQPHDISLDHIITEGNTYIPGLYVR